MQWRAAAAASELEALDRDHLDARPCAARCWCRCCARRRRRRRARARPRCCRRPTARARPRTCPRRSRSTRIFATPSASAISSGSVPALLLDHQVARRESPGPDRPGARPVDDLREQRDQVAVAHRDHRVQVHVAARLRQVHGQHLRGRPGPEQRPGDPQHRLRRGPLAHADHHRAVADRLHVAALDVAAAPVLVDAAQPDRELLGGEHRVEPVDRLHDHRLRLAGRLGHRVDRDPVEDPARRVALEQEVRQRRQQHASSGRPTPTPAPRPAATSALVIPPIRNSATVAGVRRSQPTRGPAARR